MKTFILEDIELKKAMDFLDECKKEDAIQIYIYSNGGAVWEFDAFLTRMNEMLEEGYDITLRCHHASSAAFELLYEFKGKKKIERDCDAVVHIARIDSAVNGHVICSNDPCERGRHEWFKKQEPYPYDFLSKSEAREYLKGKDIYINPERMKKIFANPEK